MEDQLILNAQIRANAAKEGVSTNGRLPTIVDEPQPQKKRKLREWLKLRFEFPEWGSLRMSPDASRFTMPYSLLSIMVALLGIVIAAAVTIGLAGATAVIYLVISTTKTQATVEAMVKEQQLQRIEIGGLWAYSNRAMQETMLMKAMLPERSQNKVEQWEKDNPLTKLDEPKQENNH